jgi:hypothetical protein
VFQPNAFVFAASTVSVQASATIREEVFGMWKVIKDWRMIVLLPMFFASNYFYAYVSAQSEMRRWRTCSDR